MYYRGAAVAIVVYDITRKTSFENVGKAWINELKKQGPANIMIALVGNKCDLSDDREVQRDTAKQYAQKIGAPFIETSAKTAKNVALMFQEIAKRLPSADEMRRDDIVKVDDPVKLFIVKDDLSFRFLAFIGKSCKLEINQCVPPCVVPNI